MAWRGDATIRHEGAVKLFALALGLFRPRGAAGARPRERLSGLALDDLGDRAVRGGAAPRKIQRYGGDEDKLGHTASKI